MAYRRRWWLALSAVLAVTGVLVARQPLSSPWWFYADADAPYVSSGLNLLAGEPTKFFDHPGLPLQQLIALTFGARLGIHDIGGGGHVSRRQYADRLMLDLDATRPYYRTYGVLVYVAGVVLAFALIAGLFGSVVLGLAGSLLWLGAPGLLPMSMQYRADPLLALLVLAGSVLIARAARTRNPFLFLGAGMVLGFGLTVKYSAIVLAAPLAVTAVWRPPAEGWSAAVGRRGLESLRGKRGAWAILATGWLAVAAVLNWAAGAFHPSGKQIAAALVPLAGIAIYLALSAALLRRTAATRLRVLLRPFAGSLLGAILVGLLIPASLTIADGFQMLIWLGRDFTGGGSNANATAFSSFHWREFGHFPLLETLPVFAAAGVSGVLGVVERRPAPVAWTAGAAFGLVLFAAKFGSVYYAVPAFVLAVLAALHLASRAGRLAPALLVPLVAVVLVPQIRHASGPRHAARAEERVAAAALASMPAGLGHGQVAVTSPAFAVADTRFFEFVQLYARRTPVYPYRFLPATSSAYDYARGQGLVAAYEVVESAGHVPPAGTAVQIDGWGSFEARGVVGDTGTVRFLRLRRAG